MNLKVTLSSSNSLMKIGKKTSSLTSRQLMVRIALSLTAQGSYTLLFSSTNGQASERAAIAHRLMNPRCSIQPLKKGSWNSSSSQMLMQLSSARANARKASSNIVTRYKKSLQERPIGSKVRLYVQQRWGPIPIISIKILSDPRMALALRTSNFVPVSNHQKNSCVYFKSSQIVP